MQTVMVGRAHVQVEVKGCFRCGTQYGSGWKPVRDIPVMVGERKLTVGISICADCSEDEIPEGSEPPMKGRIGRAGRARVHLLDKVDRPEYGAWANAACGKWAGSFDLVPEKEHVTCPDCKKLDPLKIRTKTVPHDPVPSGIF
jgi:hypothetical protein